MSIIEKSSFLLALIAVSIGFSLSDSCIHANTKLLCARWMNCYWITWSIFGVLEVGLGAGVRCQAYRWTIILKISWQWKQSLDDRCVSDSWLATGSPPPSPILQGQRTPKPLVLLSLLAWKQTFAQPENLCCQPPLSLPTNICFAISATSTGNGFTFYLLICSKYPQY